MHENSNYNKLRKLTPRQEALHFLGVSWPEIPEDLLLNGCCQVRRELAKMEELTSADREIGQRQIKRDIKKH